MRQKRSLDTIPLEPPLHRHRFTRIAHSGAASLANNTRKNANASAQLFLRNGAAEVVVRRYGEGHRIRPIGSVSDPSGIPTLIQLKPDANGFLVVPHDRARGIHSLAFARGDVVFGERPLSDTDDVYVSELALVLGTGRLLYLASSELTRLRPVATRPRKAGTITMPPQASATPADAGKEDGLDLLLRGLRSLIPPEQRAEFKRRVSEEF